MKLIKKIEDLREFGGEFVAYETRYKDGIWQEKTYALIGLVFKERNEDYCYFSDLIEKKEPCIIRDLITVKGEIFNEKIVKMRLLTLEEMIEVKISLEKDKKYFPDYAKDDVVNYIKSTIYEMEREHVTKVESNQPGNATGEKTCDIAKNYEKEEPIKLHVALGKKSEENQWKDFLEYKKSNKPEQKTNYDARWSQSIKDAIKRKSERNTSNQGMDK